MKSPWSPRLRENTFARLVKTQNRQKRASSSFYFILNSSSNFSSQPQSTAFNNIVYQFKQYRKKCQKIINNESRKKLVQSLCSEKDFHLNMWSANEDNLTFFLGHMIIFAVFSYFAEHTKLVGRKKLFFLGQRDLSGRDQKRIWDTKLFYGFSTGNKSWAENVNLDCWWWKLFSSLKFS